MVKLAGATPKFALADDTTGFRLTPEMVEAGITPRTKLLILNSPSIQPAPFIRARNSRPLWPSL